MKVTIAPPVPQFGDYAAVVREPASWQRYFADVIAADPRVRGRVLDVGCKDRPHMEENLRLVTLPAQLDGVDPMPLVQENPYLTRRWQGFFESCPDIPAGAYDAIVSFQVVEHVEKAEAFIRAAYRALKPGGVFYATTPHAGHPFAWCVRGLDLLRIKHWFGDEDDSERINAIPTYYRLNRRGPLARMGGAAGFESLHIVYYPNIGWQYYFPKAVRFIPAAYDRLLATRIPRLAMLMLYRLEKPASATN